jgi:hypothetical protein
MTPDELLTLAATLENYQKLCLRQHSLSQVKSVVFSCSVDNKKFDLNEDECVKLRYALHEILSAKLRECQSVLTTGGINI